MENVKLSSPWDTYWHKLKCLFGDDPDIELVYLEDEHTVKFLVNSIDKANALTELLQPEIKFGNVAMQIQVIPANAEKKFADLVYDALRGNPHFKEFISISLQTNPIHYAIFKKEVAQYFNDNLSDAHGNVSTLYEELAREILGQDGGVHYCTDNEDAVGKPLGEWP